MTETLTAQCTLDELGRLSEWVDTLASQWGLPTQTTFAIQLCCEEVFSNIVRHGHTESNVDQSQATAQVSLSRSDDSITLTLQDRGPAFNPLTVDAPAMPSTIGEMQIGGLGIHLIRKFSQDVQYNWRDGYNCLTMRFDLASNPQAANAQSPAMA
jgi:anti-sigma regulatory factor (Ser/Thr protein kinase)